jgi:zinc transport system ATP-binding protein
VTPLLDIRDLDFNYGPTPVLSGIRLAVAPGSTLGVIGPNGGGKSTLLRLILGLLKPTRGSILIDGLAPVDAVKRGSVVGYLPQNPQLAQRFPIDVTQLVELGLAGRTGLLRGAPAEDIAFARELIDSVGLAEYRNTPIPSLSGGQLQRALIARALVTRPKLLLLDEPTVGVDHRGQQEFIQLIHRLKQRLSLTVVFVSHDLRAVTSISDRIACVQRTLHFHDTPNHLPADVVYNLFACDLAAIGVGTRCDDPSCDGQHSAAHPNVMVRP